MNFGFGNVVIVEDSLIGVVVKSWADGTHDVYVREYNGVQQYDETAMKHFIYNKTLTEEEQGFYQL